jgi:hypothetical protein
LSVNTAKAPVTEPELPPDAAYHDRTSTSVHDPPAALAPLGNLPPVILSAPETAGETPVEALKSGAPKDDRRPAAPSRATSNPSDASPPVIPASRETDREMSPAMTPVPEDADETPAEALKSGAPKDDRRPAAPSQVPPNPSDTWQPPVSAAQKKPLVASDGPSSADRENDDGASPTGNPAREPKAPTPASTEVADPADIIKWLLEEKNKGASAPAPR